MKRLLIITAIISLFISSAALAHNVDLKSLSEDDLLQLKEDITEELKERGIEENPTERLSVGCYTIGEDIVSGQYTFSPIDDNSRSIIKVYASMDDYLNKKKLDDYPIIPTRTASISLEDGQILEIFSWDAMITRNKTSAYAP